MLYVDVFCYRPVQYSGDTKGYESLSLLSAWAMIFKLPALKVLRASNMALVQLRGCLRCMKMYWTGHELLSKAARHEWTRKFAFRHSVVILREIVTRPTPRLKRHIRMPHRSYCAGETLFLCAILRLWPSAQHKNTQQPCVQAGASCREMNVHPYLLSVFSASFLTCPWCHIIEGANSDQGELIRSFRF